MPVQATTTRICRVFKPSDGLEPETPSLPCALRLSPPVARDRDYACKRRILDSDPSRRIVNLRHRVFQSVST